MNKKMKESDSTVRSMRRRSMEFLLILGKFTRVPNDMFAKFDLLWFQFEMDRRTAKIIQNLFVYGCFLRKCM